MRVLGSHPFYPLLWCGGIPRIEFTSEWSYFYFHFIIIQILHCVLFFRNIAIIGGNSGQLIFYSLTQARYLASLNTGIKTPIFSLSICSDFFRDFSYLIVSIEIFIISNSHSSFINLMNYRQITNDLRQQWKLLLEKEVNGEHFILVSFEHREIR